MNGFKLLFAALAAFLLLLAACGGDDEDAAPSPAPTAPPAAETATPAPAGEVISSVFSCDDAPAASEPDAGAFPVTVVDDGGNEVTLDEPPAAIASLSGAHTEILFAIGGGDQVVAVDNFSDCPAAAAALPSLDSFSPSVEAIVDMEPDLVVLFFDPGDLAQSIEAAGIPVVLLFSPASVEGVYEQIELLGDVTGQPVGAAALIAAMQEAVSSILGRVEGTDGPRVFHEIDTSYYSAGPGSFVADLYSILGAENIADATGEAFPLMNAEAVIAADPEVIVLANEAAGESPETVAARPGWSDVSAVQNGRVYLADPDILSRPGPRLVDALHQLAGFLYPEVYP